MKTSRILCSLTACVLFSASITGCNSVHVLPAKAYDVTYGDTTFVAKSVKLHGSWAELETDRGTIWANGVKITPRK